MRTFYDVVTLRSPIQLPMFNTDTMWIRHKCILQHSIEAQYEWYTMRLVNADANANIHFRVSELFRSVTMSLAWDIDVFKSWTNRPRWAINTIILRHRPHSSQHSIASIWTVWNCLANRNSVGHWRRWRRRNNDNWTLLTREIASNKPFYDHFRNK